MIKNERGFSLFEMAIVLVIFGLVLASASSVLTLFVNRGGSEKTRQMMEANKNAL
ncbi:type II secretion system protein, partial [Seleniivibrio woodruffii]